MEDGFALRNATVGIFGLGLMGGSLARALKGACAHLIGFDTDPATLELARANNIVDQADSALKPHPLVSGAPSKPMDLLILAMPVPVILEFLQQLPLLISYPCIVMDIGSTKREILRAMSALPANFDPIGGHPICGKEKLGLENADANLFRNAPFAITPLDRTTRRAKSAAQQAVSLLGARYIEMDPENHDHILAATSHLPFLISSALAGSTPQEFASLLGTGFRSTSRLAGTPSHMMLGVLQSNRENILNAIQTFCRALHELELALQNEDYTNLEMILDRSRTEYLSLTSN